MKTVRPEKRVVLKLSRAIDRADVAALGDVVEMEPGKVVLQVKPDALQAAVGAAMTKLPVADLVIEDPPLEEVLREVFGRERERRPA